MQLDEVLHNAHPKRNVGSAKRGEPSAAKSGKPINVVHMSSTFAPSLTTAIIFRCLGYHDCYRKRGLHLPMDERKLELVEVPVCSQKKNTRREYRCL